MKEFINSVCCFFLALLIISLTCCAQYRSVEQTENFWERGKIRVYAFGTKEDDFTIQEMQDMGINLVGGGADYHLHKLRQLKDDQAVKERIAELHRAGIKVIGRTSLIIVRWKDLYKQFPETKDHVVLGPDGKPQLWQRRPQSHIVNILDPYWFNLHASGIKYATQMGDDAFHYDNTLVILSYDERTQKMWHEYIVETLGADISKEAAKKIDWQRELKVEEDFIGNIPILFQDVEKRKDRIVQANLDVLRYSQFVKFLEKIKYAANEVGSIKLRYTGHMGPRSMYYWTEGRHVTDIVGIENSTANS